MGIYYAFDGIGGQRTDGIAEAINDLFKRGENLISETHFTDDKNIQEIILKLFYQPVEK